MSNIQTQRAKLADLWNRRHYYPEQGFDLIYLEELNELRRLEAAEALEKSDRYHRIYLEYQASQS